MITQNYLDNSNIINKCIIYEIRGSKNNSNGIWGLYLNKYILRHEIILSKGKIYHNVHLLIIMLCKICTVLQSRYLTWPYQNLFANIFQISPNNEYSHRGINITIIHNDTVLFQLQMRISFPFLLAKYKRRLLLIMRTCSFLTLLCVGGT